jgi:transposase
MSRRKSSRSAKRTATPGPRPPPHLEIEAAELAAILEQAKNAPLTADGYAKLKAMTDTLVFLLAELQAKTTSLERLRQMLFGAKTEKTSQVLGEEKPGGEEGSSEPEPGADPAKPAPEKQPGHGRNGAAAFIGAKKVKVPHPTLGGGDCCPGCAKGKVYPLSVPATLLRITGMAPLGATVYERDRLRCNLCGEVFTAQAPEGVGEAKYDETATGMVGLLKYGTGLPFNRIEKLQAGMGIPLPAATQWDLVHEGAKTLAPVHEELIDEAAQGKVLHNDDTTMKVLELSKEQRAAAAADEQTNGRTGVFTSGIVSTSDDHRIALFFTGVQHAGENLADVLARRAAELPKPIQMCDALSANTAGDFDALVANCTSHSRRKYVEVAADFPEACRFVLESLRGVYKNDTEARKQGMSLEQRLSFHQAESGPLMDSLEKWMRRQFEEHLVEPNSGLGEAIKYMQKHWSKLTLFLRVAGAPLDNNICERALKKAILHRKNALFYKTLNGAHVGDVFMSLIHTAELNGIAPFDYLVALLRHPEEIADAPAEWMPWNYRQTLARQKAAGASGTDPPA